MSVTSVVPHPQVSPASISVHGPRGPGGGSPFHFMRFGLPSIFGKKSDGYGSLEYDSEAPSVDHAEAQRAAVATLKTTGRQAHAQAASLGSTRTGDVGADLRSIGFDTVMMGADVMLPGAGTAGGAASKRDVYWCALGSRGDESLDASLISTPTWGGPMFWSYRGRVE